MHGSDLLVLRVPGVAAGSGFVATPDESTANTIKIELAGDDIFCELVE